MVIFETFFMFFLYIQENLVESFLPERRKVACDGKYLRKDVK